MDVTHYLETLGQNPQVDDRQYRQALKAIQFLFILIGAPWVKQINWLFLEQSSKILTEHHPTIAREDGDSSTPKYIEQTLNKKHAQFDFIKKQYKAVLTQLIYEIRRRAYSIRTEETYVTWVLRFLAAYAKDEIQTVGAKEVTHFLEDLAVKRYVAASTQNQALCALAFFFEHALKAPLDDLKSFKRAKKPKQLPVVLTQHEVNTLLNQLHETPWLMASLLYGTGIR